MFRIVKLLGFDSGIELSDFGSNKPLEEGEAPQEDQWYTKLLVDVYQYFFKFLKYAW